LPVVWSQQSRVHLGNVQRMTAAAYERLLLSSWPQAGGLEEAKPIASVADLETLVAGTWKFVVDPDSSWRVAARYLRLQPMLVPELPGAYRGVLRLRWHGAVLYVLLKGSVLLPPQSQVIPRAISAQSFPSKPPVLLAPNVFIVVGSPGASCDTACADVRPDAAAEAKWALRCHNEDLLFVNGCGALSRYGKADACQECVASEGWDKPSVVVATDAADAPASGTCLWSANLADPPRCEASHPWTSRICTCRTVPLNTTIAPSGMTIAGNTTRPRRAPPIEHDFRPELRVDSSVPGQRCGGGYKNLLSSTCNEEGNWCCAADMQCGSSTKHCGQRCRRKGGSPDTLCGEGWTLRLPELGHESLAER